MAETTVLRSSAVNRTPNGGAKPQTQLSGAHPVVQVNMNSGGPQVQGQGTLKQGVTLLPPKGARRNFTTGGLPNQPAKQGVVILPPKDLKGIHAGTQALTEDQLLFCRHLADKYLGEVRVTSGEAQLDEAAARNVQIAEGAIAAIDAAMAEITAAAAAAAAPPPRAVTAGPRPSQAGATPRRVARPAGQPPPPPVMVKMDNGQPVPDLGGPVADDPPADVAVGSVAQ